MSTPLQVYLDDGDFARLEEWARKRGWTKSQAVRAAIRALTRPVPEDSLIELSGMIDGLPVDAAENFDRYLDATYVAEKSPSYDRRRAPRGTRR